jgi:hypothetical protein
MLVVLTVGLSLAGTLVLGCSSSNSPEPAESAPLAQEPVIYIEPSTGTVESQFQFAGSGFEPAAKITVSFSASSSHTIALASNPLVAEDDGTFRLTIVPMNDLTNEPGNPHSVHTGRWLATFTLSAETYYQQEFSVDR